MVRKTSLPVGDRAGRAGWSYEQVRPGETHVLKLLRAIRDCPNKT